MIKPTPNPPETDPASPYASPDSKQFQEAAERALNHYLNPAANIMAVPHKPSTMFIINPDIDTESLLAHACESLASANVMTNDLAGFWRARIATRCWALLRSSCWVSWQ